MQSPKGPEKRSAPDAALKTRRGGLRRYSLARLRPQRAADDRATFSLVPGARVLQRQRPMRGLSLAGHARCAPHQARKRSVAASISARRAKKLGAGRGGIVWDMTKLLFLLPRECGGPDQLDHGAAQGQSKLASDS